jgi:hypothetical protein
MSGKTRYLYILQFGVKKDSGLAIIVAYSEREAIQILNNSGMYARSVNKYQILQIRCLGPVCTCDYGLILESYVNAIVAFQALVSVMDKIVGPPGPPGPPGPQGPPGEVTEQSIEQALGYVPAKITVKNTVEWNAAVGYVPEKGEIIVYADYGHIEKDGQLIDVPGVKIGSGNGYVQDLAFIGGTEDEELLLDHINNNVIHVTAADKQKWDAKLNVDDNNEVVNEALVFIRN